MAFSSGRSKTGGRRAGTPNLATQKARLAISTFIDGNIDKLQGWLEEIHKQEGALAAFKCITDLLEYHIPKLSRAELVPERRFEQTEIKPVSPEEAKAAYEKLQQEVEEGLKAEGLPTTPEAALIAYREAIEQEYE